MNKPQTYTNSKDSSQSRLGGESITFPLVVFSMINHEGYIQMSFCLKTPKLEIPKFSKLELLAFWKAITSFADL